MIDMEFTRENLLALLSEGRNPSSSSYSHKQIAEWCESFWNKYADIDAPEDLEKLMPVLADVENQWDLYLVNTYSPDELGNMDFEKVELPLQWFDDWLADAKA